MDQQSNRSSFVLASIGAWLASAYWAALTLLIVFGVVMGSVSGVQIILPCVLIGFYAWRGFQVFKGDRRAAKGLLWLHGVGAAMAMLRMSAGGTVLVVLYAIKIAIHIFGAVTAYLAQRASSPSPARRVVSPRIKSEEPAKQWK